MGTLLVQFHLVSVNRPMCMSRVLWCMCMGTKCRDDIALI